MKPKHIAQLVSTDLCGLRCRYAVGNNDNESTNQQYLTTLRANTRFSDQGPFYVQERSRRELLSKQLFLSDA